MRYFRQTRIKTLIIFFLFTFLYGGGNIYGYVVFKTQYNTLKNIYESFANPKNIEFIYKQPEKIKTNSDAYTYFSNIKTDTKGSASLDLGISLNINELLKKRKETILHNYDSDILNQQTLNGIYESNLKTLNYYRDRFLKSVKNLFTYFSKYIPKYGLLAEKYDIRPLNSEKNKLFVIKPRHVNREKLEQKIKKLKKNLLNKIYLANDQDTLRNIQARLKIYVTKTNDDQSANISLNLKFAPGNDTSLKIAKLKLINLINQKIYKIYALADSVNQSYAQYRQVLFNAEYTLKSASYELLKMKNAIAVDMDALSSKYIKTYGYFYTLNSVSVKNNNQYLQLFMLLKELDEY